ncbi:DUF4065 domain-containing protein [Candidatus Saccharibacteria bacterium]|nr:DUF4065 domain-containing protein [Candidatus Saccharibacteria bacterium]
MDAKVIASYFIKKANRLGEEDADFDGNNDLTNLKLQKILYFSQAEYMRENNGKKLFNNDIEAWQYGPVVKDVYEWLRGCGAFAITEMDVELCNTDTIPDDVREFLDRMWNKYNTFSAWGLVQKTHKAGSAWSKTYRGGLGNRSIISPSLMATSA